MLPAGAWMTDLSVTSGGTTTSLVIGVDEAATDGFDSGLDIPLPPAPPGSTFSAYLVSTGMFPMLQTDIRNAPGWTLSVEAKESMHIVWAASPAPLTITISDQVHPMSAAGEAILPAGSYQLLIQSTGEPAPVVVPIYESGDDPLPTATATPLPDETTPPVTANPLPSQTPEPIPLSTPPPDTSLVVTATPDLLVTSPAAPVPTEAGLSLVPVMGGVIIAGCLVWLYPRWRKR
jgi:hypothetical protein